VHPPPTKHTSTPRGVGTADAKVLLTSWSPRLDLDLE
jgi:hypothetical protein